MAEERREEKREEKVEVEKEVEKPITIKGESTILTIFIRENRITLNISRRTQTGGFERIDRFVIPTDYLIYKLFEKRLDLFGMICELVDKLRE
jgi:hypothetical protein